MDVQHTYYISGAHQVFFIQEFFSDEKQPEYHRSDSEKPGGGKVSGDMRARSTEQCSIFRAFSLATSTR